MAQRTQQVVLPRLRQSTVFRILGEKWTIEILGALQHKQRFSGLRQEVGCGSKVLSARLKELEHSGILTKTIYAEVPVRVEYELTGKGEELVAILAGLSAWEKKQS